MLSIKGLFEATKHEIENRFMPCPKDHSRQHKEDLKEVIRCYNSPSLNKEFLALSDKSSKKVFKKFLKKNNIDFNWSKIKPACKRTGVIIGYEKKKYKRKRPKAHLIEIDDMYNDIKHMSSFSFPSGHTAEAYFIAGLLSDFFPSFRSSFENIAMLIGQSRIENGVHYPTDVMAGRLLGEKLADDYLNKNSNHKDEKKKSKRKDFIKKLHKTAKKLYPNLNQTDQLKQYCEDITQYIEMSNDIEDINSDNVYESCKNFLLGYPSKECTSDPYVFSHFKILENIYNNDFSNSRNFLSLHKEMHEDILDKGTPGEFRTNQNKEYVDVLKIPDYIKKIKSINNPYAKHFIFEWIHPYPDGNGRIGRAILAKDLNYNFQKVCNFCNQEYIANIKKFKNHYRDIDKAIKILS